MFTRDDAGCWIDSGNGIYTGEGVIALARKYGYDPGIDSVTPDDEDYFLVWQEAEDYLQSFAPEGYYFGINHSGDWGLWPNPLD